MKPLHRVLLLALAIAALSVPAYAQLVTVDDEFYVTDLRAAKHEIGVAGNKGADTRNWIHVRSECTINLRQWLGNGRGFRDQRISRERLFQLLKQGSKIKVHGGRAWDQSIVAKKIWL